MARRAATLAAAEETRLEAAFRVGLALVIDLETEDVLLLLSVGMEMDELGIVIVMLIEELGIVIVIEELGSAEELGGG